MILADEGLNANFIKTLREIGYNVEWIADIQRGMDDFEIIQLAKEKGKILITEDKDFGEWVFAHRISGLSIIFLRYDKVDFPKVSTFLQKVLKTIGSDSSHEFITINKQKVRRRKI